MAMGVCGLFNPPGASSSTLSWWLVANLLLVYTAFSMVTVSYQAHGAEIPDDLAQRQPANQWQFRVADWREHHYQAKLRA